MLTTRQQLPLQLNNEQFDFQKFCGLKTCQVTEFSLLMHVGGGGGECDVIVVYVVKLSSHLSSADTCRLTFISASIET